LPGVAAVADTYGRILVQTGAAESGAKILEQAAQQAPSDGEILFHFADALAAVGQQERALQVVRHALEVDTRFSSRGDAQQLLAKLQQVSSFRK
jgi:Flp pilus assembly protein TadD